MFGNSSDGSTSRAGVPVGGEGVLGEVSEAELDAFVSKLRTDKKRVIPAAEPQRSQPEVERLHRAGGRPLISCMPEAAAHAWHAVLDGKASGPHELAVLKDRWERGELGPDSLCWREGFKAWVPVCQVPELTEALAPLPDEWLPESLDALDALEARVEAVPDGGEAPDFVLKGAEALRFLTEGPRELEPEPVTQVPLPAAAEPEPAAVEPVGTHALVPLPVVAAQAAAPEREEPRSRGFWLALVGGVMGGVTVALSLVLLLSWGARAPLSRLFSSAPVAGPGVASQGGAVGASAALVPASGQEARVAAAATSHPGGAAGVGGAPVLAPGQGGGAAEAGAGPGRVGGASAAAGPALSLGSSPVVDRGGAVPVLPAMGGSVAASVVAPPAPPSTPLETASLPARAPVARPKVPAAALALEKRSAESPPAPKELAFAEPETEGAAAPAEEEELDLGPDEEFERELAEPPASIKRAKASGERTVFVPPSPGQPPVSLAQSDVFEVVLANKGDITACASAQPQKQGGRVVVRWSIRPTGKVDDVVMETAALKGTPLADCIEARIRAWTFPKHQEQGAPVRFPFVF